MFFASRTCYTPLHLFFNYSRDQNVRTCNREEWLNTSYYCECNIVHVAGGVALRVLLKFAYGTLRVLSKFACGSVEVR